MKSIVKGDFSTLNINHDLFVYLAKKPQWWNSIIQDKTLYIEIRKDNYINVYYQDGCVVLLQWSRGHLRATTHKKYLLNISVKKELSSTPYWDVTDNLLYDRNFICRLKENINDFYGNDIRNLEDYREKYIQWQVATDNKDRIIDTEFAYNLDKDIPDLRIDLVSVNHEGALNFIELKRINDNRLLNKNLSEPEVVRQIEKYSRFIEIYQSELLAFYQKIYEIKEKLGVINTKWEQGMEVFQSKPCSVNLQPQLLIADLYEKIEYKRKNRIINIRKCLSKINFQFFTVMNRKFYEEIRKQQEKKYQDGIFGDGKNNGTYRKKKYLFVLDAMTCENNLFPEIRQDALDYFSKDKGYDIKWWGENAKQNKPSGHMVSSQIHCLNHLFAIRKNETAVLAIINNAVKDKGIFFDKVLPMDIDNKEKSPNYIAFEFRMPGYLDENDSGARRGGFCTSVDAAVYAQKGSDVYFFPIEWKFTETYNFKDKTNRTRMERYGNRICCSSQLTEPTAGVAGSLYMREPYYELMRQTLLAEQMINEKKAAKFIHFNIIPAAHTQLRNAINRYYIPMLKDKNKFLILDPQELLAPLTKIVDEKNTEFPEFDKIQDLITYLKARYWE